MYLLTETVFHLGNFSFGRALEELCKAPRGLGFVTLILNYGRPGLPKHGGMGGLSVVRRAATLTSTMLSTAPADVVTGCGVRVGERLAEHRQSSIG